MAEPFYPPENYYRVSIKALIFDNQGRLLISKDKGDEWEIPGGGWDHEETYQDCLKRELNEELGATVRSIGPMAFFYRHEAQHGQPKVSLAFRVELTDIINFKLEDTLAEARFVTKAEFMELPFQKSETPVKQRVDDIWQLVEKTEENR